MARTTRSQIESEIHVLEGAVGMVLMESCIQVQDTNSEVTLPLVMVRRPLDLCNPRQLPMLTLAKSLSVVVNMEGQIGHSRSHQITSMAGTPMAMLLRAYLRCRLATCNLWACTTILRCTR